MALYKAAKEKDALAKVETDLKALKKLTETDRGVRDFFQTPVLNVAQKKSGVRARPPLRVLNHPPPNAGPASHLLVAYSGPVPAMQNARQIVSIAKKIGFSPVTTNFLNVLAENSRMNQLHKVTESFATILAAHRGEVQATITTAKEIDSKIRTQLEAAIKKNFVKAGESLSVTTKVCSSLPRRA